MDSKRTNWHWGLATGPNLELSLLVAKTNLKALRVCPVLLPDQRTPCAHALPKRKLRFCEQHKQECRASHAEYKSLSATVLALRRKLEAVLESLFDSDSDPDSDSVATRRGDRHAGTAHVHGSGWSDLGPRGGGVRGGRRCRGVRGELAECDRARDRGARGAPPAVLPDGRYVLLYLLGA